MKLPPLNTDAVKEFALDVWEDLRRTRLAGVALGMTLTLLVVSGIVLKPSGPPEIKTNYTPANSTPAKNISFAIPGEEPMMISDLELEEPRDPFRSLGQLDAQPEGAVQSTSVEETVTASGGGSGSNAVATSNTTDLEPSAALKPLDELEIARDNTTSTEKQAEVDPPEDKKADDTKTEETPQAVTDYSYVTDLQFGPTDKLRTFRSVKRLGLVPSRELPYLMFLGVDSTKKTAVFMIDSRLSQGGEGNCLPSASQCTFLELKASGDADEHHFRDGEGKEYLVRLRRIVRASATAGSVGGEDVAALPGTPSLVDGSR